VTRPQAEGAVESPEAGRDKEGSSARDFGGGTHGPADNVRLLVFGAVRDGFLF